MTVSLNYLLTPPQETDGFVAEKEEQESVDGAGKAYTRGCVEISQRGQHVRRRQEGKEGRLHTLTMFITGRRTKWESIKMSWCPTVKILCGVELH